MNVINMEYTDQIANPIFQNVTQFQHNGEWKNVSDLGAIESVEAIRLLTGEVYKAGELFLIKNQKGIHRVAAKNISVAGKFLIEILYISKVE